MRKSILPFFKAETTTMQEQDLLIKMGHKIKMIRLKKNITQNNLANRCDFEKASMSRIESGRSNPTIRTLFKISNKLEVPISEFFKD